MEEKLKVGTCENFSKKVKFNYFLIESLDWNLDGKGWCSESIGLTSNWLKILKMKNLEEEYIKTL